MLVPPGELAPPPRGNPGSATDMIQPNKKLDYMYDCQKRNWLTTFVGQRIFGVDLQSASTALQYFS